MTSATSGFEPIRQLRVHEQVAHQLRARILAGELHSGERLPPEQDLIQEFEVSRTAIRQAMQLLEQQGLVDVRVGSGGGCFVAPSRLDSILVSFTNLFALRGIEVDEFLAAKSEIEPTIFGVAARNITPEQLAELEHNLGVCREAVEAGDEGDLFDLTHDFHRIVGRATANQLLEMVLMALVDVAGRIPKFRGAPEGGWGGVLDDHAEILDGLGRADEAHVREVARRHASSVRQAFRDRAAESSPSG